MNSMVIYRDINLVNDCELHTVRQKLNFLRPFIDWLVIQTDYSTHIRHVIQSVHNLSLKRFSKFFHNEVCEHFPKIPLIIIYS